MRRRRSAQSESSLELLLDTITNAFGGVIFLAILISIQLQQRSMDIRSEKDLSKEIEQVRVSSSIANVEANVKQLLDAIQRQRDLQQDFRERSGEKAIDDIFVLQEQLGAFTAEKTRLEKEIVALKNQMADAVNKASTATASVESVRKSVKKKDDELKSEIKKRTVSGRLPRMRLSLKSEVPIVARYDRVYKLRSDGAFNDKEFFIEDGQRIQLTPKPYRGLPIVDGPNFDMQFIDKIDASAARDYIAVVIWEDSFDSFLPIRNALVDAGFEYRLVLAREGDKIESGFAVPWVQ